MVEIERDDFRDMINEEKNRQAVQKRRQENKE